MSSSGSLLSVEDFSVHYRTRSGPVRAADGATLSVPAGSIAGLVGELRMSLVPQTAISALDPVQQLRAHVAEVLCQRGGWSRAAAAVRAAELFDLVGLPPERLANCPHQFSGGMRQRASIALALALNPALAIADEPVTALDVIVQRRVLAGQPAVWAAMSSSSLRGA